MKKPIKTAESFTFIPLGDRIIVEPQRKEKSVIILADDKTQDFLPNKGTVIAVGPGKYDNNGNLIPMQTKVGDLIMFHPNAVDFLGTSKEDMLFLLQESAVQVKIIQK